MLTDFFEPRQTELGKIKIGGKSSQVRRTSTGVEWRAPEKHDYFTITTMNRTPAGDLVEDTELMERLAEKYADPNDHRLRRLPIRVLSNDPEEVMQSAYVWYAGKALGARSDTKTVTWFADPQTQRRLAEPKEEPWDPKFLELRGPGRNGQPGPKLFKLHSTFSCAVSVTDARWGGVYKFRTTSRISGEQLFGSLIGLLKLTGGILVGMPLEMVVRPIIVAPEGKPTTVYVVHVELRGSEMKAIQQTALDQMRYALEFKGEMIRTQAAYRKMLVAPGFEADPKEAAEIAEEFQPETVDTDAVVVSSQPGAAHSSGSGQAAPQDEDPLFAAATAPADDPQIPQGDAEGTPEQTAAETPEDAKADEHEATTEGGYATPETPPPAKDAMDAEIDAVMGDNPPPARVTEPAPAPAEMGSMERDKIFELRKALGLTTALAFKSWRQMHELPAKIATQVEAVTVIEALEKEVKEKKAKPRVAAAKGEIEHKCPGCGSVDCTTGKKAFTYVCTACGKVFED
jgi:predicted RNA-binding Zn-ribbon protein involved in translation (DUF1610 family)